MYITLLILSYLPLCQARNLRDLNVKIVGSVYDYFDEDFDVQQEVTTTTSTASTTSATSTTSSTSSAFSTLSSSTSTTIFVPDLPVIDVSSTTEALEKLRSSSTASPTAHQDENNGRPVMIFHDSSVLSVKKVSTEEKKQVSGREFIRNISAAIEGLRQNLTESFDWIKSSVAAANSRQWEEIKKLSGHVNDINNKLPAIEGSASQVGLLHADVRELTKSVHWLRENAETTTDVSPESMFSR